MKQSLRVSVLVLLTVVSGIAGLSGSVTAEQDLAVESVNVTPSDPAPGERVRFSTTINNLQSSNETVYITDVYMRSHDSGELARVEDLGSIAVGGSMTVPLSTSFDTEGEKDLRMYVVARDSTGSQRIQYPVQVTVSETKSVQLALSVGDVIAGEASPTNVSVANGGHSTISNIEVTLRSNGQVANPRRVSGSIPAETDREYTFDVRFDDAGTGTLNASLRYTTTGGNSRTVTESMTVSVDPAGAGTEGRIQLTRVQTTNRGGMITIQGEAANVGTTNAESVLLSVQETDGVTPTQPMKEYFLGTVEGSEFGTFELTAQIDESSTSVPILIEWTADGERKREVVGLAIDTSGHSEELNQPPEQVRNGQPDDSSGDRGTIIGGFVFWVIVAVIGLSALGWFVWKRR